MDFSLTEEQELLLASIRELITTNFPEEYFRTCDQNGTYPREFMRALADNGISMLGVPEEFGGIPADYVTQMLALMEVSKCGAPAFLITNGQCIHSMRRFGSAEQLRKTAESTLETGDPAYALALTEPGKPISISHCAPARRWQNCTAHVPQWKLLMMRFKSWAVWAIPMRRASPASGVMSVVNVSAAVQTKL